jgi:hypothetical protein
MITLLKQIIGAAGDVKDLEAIDFALYSSLQSMLHDSVEGG